MTETVSSRERKVYVCVKCEKQTCSIEVEKSDGNGVNLPKYCPYRRAEGEWSEGTNRSGPLVPESIEHSMRDTGEMWVVETVLDYGKGFTSKRDVKYYYSQQRAIKDYKKRRKEWFDRYGSQYDD